MTKAPEFTACPYCDGMKFTEILQSGNAAATRVGHVFKGADIIHVVCLDCGGIIHSRVKRIDTLLTKAEKEGRE